MDFVFFVCLFESRILYYLEFGNTGVSDRLSSIPLSIVMFLRFLFCRGNAMEVEELSVFLCDYSFSFLGRFRGFD